MEGTFKMKLSFSENLVRYRKRAGLTQQQLAQKLSITPQAVSKWEKGSYPDCELLPKLSQILDVSLDVLFGLKDEDGKVSLNTAVLGELDKLDESEKGKRAMELFYTMLCAFKSGTSPEHAGLPESFTRAFTLFHGISPSEARKNTSSLRSFSRLTVELSLKGGKTMNYRIIEKPAFTVIEKAEVHRLDENDVISSTVPDVWAKAGADGTIAQLVGMASDREYIYGICYGNGKETYDEDTFEYSIAAICAEDTVAPEGFRISHIPARTWLAAECQGTCPETVQQQWREMCASFFPSSGYTPTYEMDIEVYPSGDASSPDYTFEIWVPVVKN